MRDSSISARFPRFAAALVAFAVAGTAAPAAFGQAKPGAAAPDKKTKDAARKAYGEGEKAYGEGKYAAAYDSFKKAAELIPSPHAEFWMAMALDKQGKADEATAAFEKLVARDDASKLGDEKLGQAKQRLSELKAKQVGEVNVATTPPGASVSVDGKPEPGETPMILKLAPGAHTITLSSPGYETKELKVDVTAGKRVDESVELKAGDLGAPAPTPVPAPEPAPEPAPSEPAPPAQPKSKVPAYVTLGIAGVGVAVGTFFGIKALGAKSDFEDDPTTDNADKVERNALIADMAFGVAITLGVTGVVLLTSGDGAEPAKEAAKSRRAPRGKLHVLPYAGPKGGGAAARWTF